MRSSDAGVRSLVAEARSVARVRSLRTFRGFLIGARATTMRLVPVPVRKTPKRSPTPYDVLFHSYVPTTAGADVIAYNLDTFMISVPKYPLDSPAPTPFSYTIYISDQPFADLNSLLRSFVGANELNIRGSILVMKSDSSGAICSMDSRDAFFVQRLVIDSLKPAYLDSLRFHSAKSSNSKSIHFFFTPELVVNMLSFCDFPTVMAVARTGTYGRSMARTAVLFRVRAELLPFIPREDFHTFMEMLYDTEGGIVGSVARLMLADNSLFMIQESRSGHTSLNSPFDLNIAVPVRFKTVAQTFFESLRYIGWKKLTLHPAYDDHVSEIWRAVRPAFQGAPRAKVTISLCVNGIMPVVLAAPLTALANIITSMTVYSVYPMSITQKESLRDWPKPCGPHCPAKDRRSVGDEGIALFRFNENFEEPPSRFEGTDYLLAKNVLAWKFSSRCRNVKCPNFTHPSRFLV
ncbi:hypothetical protein MD484_g8717, partial [Candolleomyces efflorescens]